MYFDVVPTNIDGEKTSAPVEEKSLSKGQELLIGALIAIAIKVFL